MTQTRSLARSKNDAKDMSTASSPSVSQPARRIKKHRKVRTGCETCKARKVKCNEARPICGNCSFQNHDCVYRQKQSPYPIFVKGDVKQDAEDEMGVLRFSARDMGLLHHWTTSTADTIGATEELRRLMREQIPIMAIGKPYLLHAVLAVTALHVAHLQPTTRPLYTALGKHHYDIALPLFRENLPFIDKSNCHPLYCCSQTIVKYLFAAETNPARFFFSAHDGSMAEMIALIKGAYLIRDTYTDWLKEGPLGAVATNLLDVEPQLTLHPYDAELDRLDERLACLADWEGPRLEPCREALQTLRHLVALNMTAESQIKTKGLCTAWLAQAPAGFFASVRERKAEAVVVLAHFCVVLEEVNNDQVWYMKGWSRCLFDECVRNLGDEWAEFVTWPLGVFMGGASVE